MKIFTKTSLDGAFNILKICKCRLLEKEKKKRKPTIFCFFYAQGEKQKQIVWLTLPPTDGTSHTRSNLLRLHLTPLVAVPARRLVAVLLSVHRKNEIVSIKLFFFSPEVSTHEIWVWQMHYRKTPHWKSFVAPRVSAYLREFVLHPNEAPKHPVEFSILRSDLFHRGACLRAPSTRAYAVCKSVCVSVFYDVMEEKAKFSGVARLSPNMECPLSA